MRPLPMAAAVASWSTLSARKLATADSATPAPSPTARQLCIRGTTSRAAGIARSEYTNSSPTPARYAHTPRAGRLPMNTAVGMFNPKPSSRIALLTTNSMSSNVPRRAGPSQRARTRPARRAATAPTPLLPTVDPMSLPRRPRSVARSVRKTPRSALPSIPITITAGCAARLRRSRPAPLPLAPSRTPR